MTDDLTFTLENKNGEITKTSTTVYLMKAGDANLDKNRLTLTITNNTGSDITISNSTPLRLINETPVHDIILKNLKFTDSDWTVYKQRHGRNHIKVGWQYIPDTPLTISAGTPKVFTLPSISFSQDDIDSINKGAKQGQIKVEANRTEESFTMMLKAYQAKPKPARLTPAFYQPSNWKWNVKQGSDDLLVPKQAYAVFANTITSQTFETHLAFHLTNYDQQKDLTLDGASFELSFNLGSSKNALSSDLATVSISKYPNGWTITKHTSQTPVTWTLKPPANSQLKQGESVSFELEGIEANGTLASDNKPADTEMYIQYSGLSGYDDGYIAATITKMAPKPQILSFEVKPQKDLYDPGEQITLSWQVFGVDTLDLIYRSDGDATYTTETLSKLKGTKTLRPPIDANQLTTLYKLQAGDDSRTQAVTVKPVTLPSSKTKFSVPIGDKTFTTTTLAYKSDKLDLTANISVYNVGLTFQSPDCITLDITLHVWLMDNTDSNNPKWVSEFTQTVSLFGTWQTTKGTYSGSTLKTVTLQLHNLIWENSLYMPGQSLDLKGKGNPQAGSVTFEYSLDPSTLSVTEVMGDLIHLYLAGYYEGHQFESRGVNLPILKKNWTLSPGTTPDNVLSDAPVQIVSEIDDSQVLDIPGANAKANADIQMYLKDSEAKGQQWQFMPVGNGWYNIVSVLNPTYVLDTQDTRVILNLRQMNQASQEWQVFHAPLIESTRYHWIMNKAQKKFIHTEGCRVNDGTAVILWHKNKQPCQHWVLQKAY